MSAIERIINWVNEADKPDWWRHAIRLALANQSLDLEHKEQLYAMARMEAGLDELDAAYSSYAASVSVDGFAVEDETVVLTSIGPVTNVSSLASDQVLEFGSAGLTAVYGDNGAGKSSYARILKNACLTRGELPQVLGNVFTKDNTVPSAIISIQRNGSTPETVEWSYQQPVSEVLKSIRVFDSSSASHYVEKEGVIEYKPDGLHLLDELVAACDFVSEKVSAELNQISKALPLPELNHQTQATEFLSNISAQTSETDVEKYCATDEELQELEELKSRLIKLKSGTPEQLKRDISARIGRIKPLLLYLDRIVEGVSDEVLSKVADLKSNYLIAKEAASLSESALTGLPLPAAGSDAWKSLWKAAKDYVAAMRPTHEFPAEKGGHCPLCMQKVTKETSLRLHNFNEYINNEVQKNAENALAAFKNEQKTIAQIVIDLSPYEAVIEEVAEMVTLFSESLDKLSKDISDRRKYLISSNADENTEFDELDLSVVDKLRGCNSGLIEQVRTVADDETLAKTISETERCIIGLEDKKVIREHRAHILAEIQRLEKVRSYGLIAARTKTASITRLATSISKDYVTSKLCDVFTEELQKLGFRNYEVKASTRGSRGSQMFKIELETDGSPALNGVASEGEQKCLALASILAELNVDGRKSGVIFDDPVNSLDHKWRRKIARRLVDEATERQVIVFTHDLPFLKMLEEAADGSFEVRALSRTTKKTGIPLSQPPWDSLKTVARIGQLKNDLVGLKKIYDDGLHDDYSEQVKKLYGKKRETWERLVEEWLIRGVVERFARGIKTQSARYLVDITHEDIAIIDQAMGKCSQFFDGHDNASELGIDIPDVREVESDLNQLDEYFKALKKRRN